MKKRVTAIVTHGKNILLIYRFKNGEEYYVFPGGGVEEGESVEEALLRELEEETGIIASLMMPLCVYKNDRLEYFFHVPCSDVETKLGGPEVDRQSEANIYRLEWIPFNKIKDLPLVPTEMKDWIVEKFTE